LNVTLYNIVPFVNVTSMYLYWLMLISFTNTFLRPKVLTLTKVNKCCEHTFLGVHLC